MRLRSLLLVMFLAALVLWPSVVSAQDAPSPSSTIPPGAVNIGDGMAFTEAVVTTEGAAPETWDANHAAVFVQSWLGFTIFGQPVLQDPPADLPVYRLDISGTWGYDPGTLTAYYASDGKTAWVSLPKDQPKRPTTGGTAPPPSRWFIAPERVVGAFNGTEELIQTAGVVQGTSTTAPPDGEQASSPSSKDDDSNAAVIGIAVLAAILVVVAVVLIRMRRTDGG